MNDEQLIAALRNRDAAAVEQMVNTHGDRLLRSAFLLCRSETEAQDIVQDTLVEAIRSIHRFQGRSAIYTWLHSILLNIARHHHRKQRRMVYDNDLAATEVPAPAPSQSPADADAAAAGLHTALQRLSDPHREVVILRYYEDMKIHEIARHLGVSTGTVKSRLHYAVKEMQALLPAELNLFCGDGTKEMQIQ
jgi:RNA polymerase sigma-70 factor (ECF subfamily)